jgi:N-acetylmuramoyl-L-alanine amidase
VTTTQDTRRRRRRLRLARLALLVGAVGTVAILVAMNTGSAKGPELIHAAPDGSARPAAAADTSSSSHASASSGGRPVDASAFAKSACMAFAPTKGDRHLTVFLDAGHGGIDPGAIGTTESGQTIEEAHETLPVELDAMAILRADGYRVVVSRTKDTSVARLTSADVSGHLLTSQGALADVAARDVCANEAKADLLVGIYFDGGSSPANAGSVTGYDAVRSFSADNHRFADLLQRDVRAAMNAKGWQIPDEGVLPDEDLGSASSEAAVDYGHLVLLGPAEAGYFSTPSEMPGALIEPLFITDPFEGSIASSAEGQKVIAEGVAKAVEQYLASDQGSAIR